MQKIKKISLVSLVLFVYLFLLPVPSKAHVLETDGSIGAVLHMDPDDDPIVGKQTDFFFAIKDKQDKFMIEKCSCRVEIKRQGKVIEEQMITDTFSYTFPTKDIYQIRFIGKPTSDSLFQPFSLTYDVRVARDTISSKSTQNTPILLLIIGSIIAGILLYRFKQ